MTTELTSVGIQAPGYRLPGQARIGRVRLQVSDLTRSAAYYTEVLGLTASVRDGGIAVLATVDGIPLVELHNKKAFARYRGTDDSGSITSQSFCPIARRSVASWRIWPKWARMQVQPTTS